MNAAFSGEGGSPLGEELFDLLATLELDALEGKLLAWIVRRVEAQGVALWVAGNGVLSLRGLRGLVAGEALPARIALEGGGADGLDQAFGCGEPFRHPRLGSAGAELLPLLHEGAPVGLLLLERPAQSARTPSVRTGLAPSLRVAALALRNARRFQELSDRSPSPEGALGGAGAWSESASQELRRARRYGRSFSLAVLSLDGGALAPGAEAQRTYAALGEAIRRSVRDADSVARVEEAAYRVLLPETDALGARIFRRRLAEEMARAPALRGVGAPWAVGTASFPIDGEEIDVLLSACASRQQEHRSSLLRALPPALREGPGNFWELFDALLEEAWALPPDPRWARLSPGAELFAAVQGEVVREMAREGGTRSALFVARPGHAHGDLIRALPGPEGASRSSDVCARVHVLGVPPVARGQPEQHPWVTRVGADGDRRFETHAFLLYLSQRASYACLQAPGERTFHCCDGPLVDALVEKLQVRYGLQPF